MITANSIKIAKRKLTILTLVLLSIFCVSSSDAYQSVEGTATLKGVGWTNPLDTTYFTSTARVFTHTSGSNAVYLSNFSGHVQEIYLYLYTNTIGQNLIDMNNSMIRWANYTSCGCDGSMNYFQFDTTLGVFSGDINFEPACYIIPPFRRIIGTFQIGSIAPKLSVVPLHKEYLKPKDELGFSLHCSLNDNENVAGASVYVNNPFITPPVETLIGTTDAEGYLTYNYTLPDNALVNDYTFEFWAVKDQIETNTVSQIVSVIDSFQLSIAVSPSELIQIPYDEHLKYTITASDDNGDLIQNAIVYVKNKAVSETFLNAGTSDANGQFIYDYQIPNTIDAKQYEITFYVAKEDYKTSTQVNRTFEVLPKDLVIKVLPSADFELVPNDSSAFNVYIRNSKNEPVANADIYISDPISNKTPFFKYATTDTTGKAIYSFKVPADANGEYEFKFFATKEDTKTDTLKRKVTVSPGIRCWAPVDGVIEFCIEGKGKFEPVGKEPKLRTNKRLLINDFLVFEGNFTIDTAALGIKADGKFYLRNIPLPGGGIGSFTVAEGSYELAFGGKDGMITNFVNAQLEKVAGFEIKMTDLQLVGGRKADGIKLSAKMSVPGISVGCNDEGESKKTEFEIKDLSITRSNGIEIGGFSAKNLGFKSFPNFCINELSGGYDSDKDKLAFGANVKIPFGEVGGGLAFVGGELDSVGFKLEASYPPLFVIGTSTVGIMGFFGHISGITQPELEFELGGILSDITSDKLYKIDVSGYYKAPATIGLKGEGTIFKQPITDKWQIKGGLEGSIDFSIYQMELKGNLKVGTNDEENYLISAESSLKYNMRQSKFSGLLKGSINLPKFNNEWPYDWINSTIGLPKTASAEARLIYGQSKTIWGDANFGPTIGTLKYVLDLNKKWGDDDFFFFERTPAGKKIKSNEKVLSGDLIENIPIAQGTERFVLRIDANGAMTQSELQSPSGTKYSSDTYNDSNPNIVLSKSPLEHKTFWTVVAPEAGDWVLKVLATDVDFDIDTYTFEPYPTFEIHTIQNLRDVNVYWQTAGLNTNGTVDLFLDDDSDGEDGFYLTSVNASNGNTTITLADSLAKCNYYIYAVYNGINYALADYSEIELINSKATLIAPQNIYAKYRTSSGKCEVEWTLSNDPNVAGYLVYAVDSEGNEKNVASSSKFDNKVMFELENHENYSIKVVSFDANGLSGCPSQPVSIITGIADEKPFTLKSNSNIGIYPNPVSSNASIRYLVDSDCFVNIKAVDMFGREIAVLVNEWKQSGDYIFSWDLAKLNSSMYYLVYKFNDRTETVKFQVIK